jgi:hypothetical protein
MINGPSLFSLGFRDGTYQTLLELVPSLDTIEAKLQLSPSALLRRGVACDPYLHEFRL